MKTITLISLLFVIHSNNLAQSASIEIVPDNGISTAKTVNQFNHKVSVKTETGNYGLLQQAGSIEVGTFIAEENGGYAAYVTKGPYNLFLSTNSQEPQVILNTLNFIGIGGAPYNALHVYGGALVYGAVNKNPNSTNSFLKVDNNGKLISDLQTGYYSVPRSAFSPLILSDGNSIAESAEGGIYYTLTKPTADCFEAPINLPFSAVITGVEFYFIDNSAANLTFMLKSSFLGVKSDIDLVILDSDNANPDVRSIAYNDINGGTGIPISPDRTYQLRISAYEYGANKAWDGQNTQIISAKITYKY